MLLGVIADDFTGASDIANTLAKGLPASGGLKTAQFRGVPTAPALKDIEAGVVALKSRSIPADEAVAQSLAALDWLKAQGCQQFIFKYCSTFDSTPEGNIGPVGEALADALGVKGVIACPAFPTVGRTIYRGHLFVHDKLLNQSGLENHPINPMTDPDIRRWLAGQSRDPVGLVTMDDVQQGGKQIKAALSAASDRGETLVIVDAISDADLVAIADAVDGMSLLTGGSGIALGLPQNFIRRGLATGGEAPVQRMSGPAAILAGSCSGATREQIEVHVKTYPTLNIDVAAVMADAFTAEDIVAFMHEHADSAPLVYSSSTPDAVAALQQKYGREAVSAKLDGLFAKSAQLLIAAGIKRLVVAGGETSGAVVTALDADTLIIGREIDPGVPALYAAGDKPFALALKSGNFGAPDFFIKALNVLEGQT